MIQVKTWYDFNIHGRMKSAPFTRILHENAPKST